MPAPLSAERRPTVFSLIGVPPQRSAVSSTLHPPHRRDNGSARPTLRQHLVGIGRRLFLTDRTVETRVGTIMAKLGLITNDEQRGRVLAVLAYLGQH
jgi:hypothetical protein